MDGEYFVWKPLSWESVQFSIASRAFYFSLSTKKNASSRVIFCTRIRKIFLNNLEKEQREEYIEHMPLASHISRLTIYLRVSSLLYTHSHIIIIHYNTWNCFFFSSLFFTFFFCVFSQVKNRRRPPNMKSSNVRLAMAMAIMLIHQRADDFIR